MTVLTTELGDKSYPIIISNNILDRANEFFDLDRRVLIVTDDGVPSIYSSKIASLCKNPILVSVKSGESSKSFDTLKILLGTMLEAGFDRGDAAVAVGGGVVGDLTAFAASIYMRGIDFYNVPTTLLSQVDSSIGGKTAINFEGVKNIVGSFSQPKAVLIDTDTLETLEERHKACGLAEAVKMSLTSNKELFAFFEEKSTEEIYENIEHVIVESLKIKKHVVELDERESGLRKILNFGHTLGHGIEATEGMGGLYHGECVALGMLPMCSRKVKDRLLPVLKKLSLPYTYKGDTRSIIAYASHDKKSSSDGISIIRVENIGEYIIDKISIDKLEKLAVFDN